jgi:hypothetical protein
MTKAPSATGKIALLTLLFLVVPHKNGTLSIDLSIFFFENDALSIATFATMTYPY